MYLLLGTADDPCCAAVLAGLQGRGCRARIVENLLSHPVRLTWHLDTDRSFSQLAYEDEPPVADDDIEGVLVRYAGQINPAGWQPDDLAYMQAETKAALLGWLWSLPCPVLNRYPAAMWYRPRLPLLFWRQLLSTCGLRALDELVSNVEDEARVFGHASAETSMTGAVYRPLTGDTSYLVVNERDWTGLAAMQRRSPVYLTVPHATPQSVCVIGRRVVWNGVPPRQAAALEPAIFRFATAAGLGFVEVVLAKAAKRLCVVAVEHHPCFERFNESTKRAVVSGLIEFLITERDAGVGRATLP
jgi:hypothetical protein